MKAVGERTHETWHRRLAEGFEADGRAMIRIVRGPEPKGLATARASKGKVAWTAYQKAKDRPDPTGYQCAKEALHIAQNKKCAYCEMVVPKGGAPVEHFRPKDGAFRHMRGAPEDLDAEHYWWLAWSWENLFFSCVRCNGKNAKGNYFPLNAGTCAAALPATTHATLDDALAAWTPDHGLLIDPGVDDPLDHLRWVPLNPSKPPATWIWTLKFESSGLSKGRATKEILKLEEFADDVVARFEKVLGDFERTFGLTNGRANFLRASKLRSKKWSDLVNRWMGPKEPLRGATWSMFDALVPEPTRTACNLPLPRP